MLTSSRAELATALVRALRRSAAETLGFNQVLAAQLGMATTDLECLGLLLESGPATAGYLADVLNLTTGAITGVVDRLETAGYVVRESDPSDRRKVIIRPVVERLAEVDRAYEPLLRSLGNVLEAYADDDLRLLVDLEQRAAAMVHHQAERMKAEQAGAAAGAVFAAPLGEITAGTLEFATGASAVRIVAHDQPDELYRASFEGLQPTVKVQGGNVTFRFRRLGVFGWGKHSGAVGLNSSIPWSIVVRGGTSRVTLEARELRIADLALLDGVSKAELNLPVPSGTVRLCVEGGVNGMEIQRPLGVPLQVQVRGGANRLELDGQRFGAIGGDVRLATPGWEFAHDRYDVEVLGGASRLGIDEIQL